MQSIFPLSRFGASFSETSVERNDWETHPRFARARVRRVPPRSRGHVDDFPSARSASESAKKPPRFLEPPLFASIASLPHARPTPTTTTTTATCSPSPPPPSPRPRARRLRAKAAKSARARSSRPAPRASPPRPPSTVADAVTAADAEWTEKAEAPAPAAFSAAIDPADGSVAEAAPLGDDMSMLNNAMVAFKEPRAIEIINGRVAMIG